MKPLLTAVAAILLITAVSCSKKTAQTDNSGKTSEEVNAMMSAPEAPPEGAMMMAADSGEGGAMMMSGGRKLEFTTLENARLLATTGPAVLFFYADWCPTCKVAMKNIDSRLSELGNIALIVVDYDDSADLKRKYGVTYQHTYVQIDADGEKLAIWNGGGIGGILENTLRGEM